MNGKSLYELYRRTPPVSTRGAAHAVAYWHGYNGIPHKYPRTSVCWWAMKAGRERRAAERKRAQQGVDLLYRVIKRVGNIDAMLTVGWKIVELLKVADEFPWEEK